MAIWGTLCEIAKRFLTIYREGIRQRNPSLWSTEPPPPEARLSGVRKVRTITQCGAKQIQQSI